MEVKGAPALELVIMMDVLQSIIRYYHELQSYLLVISSLALNVHLSHCIYAKLQGVDGWGQLLPLPPSLLDATCRR